MKLQEMLHENVTQKVIEYNKDTYLEISLSPALNSALTESQQEKLRIAAGKNSGDFRKLCDYISLFSEDIYSIESHIYGEVEAKQRTINENAHLDNLIFVSAAYSKKIGDKLVQTSTLFTRYTKDPQSNHNLGLSMPMIDEITRNTAIMYQHTIQIDLEDIESHLSNVYKKILRWKKNNKQKGDTQEKEFLSLLAEFHYMFDHMMPYIRGSAAGAEWAAQAFAKVKGYTIKQANDVVSVSQEALAQPDLQAFIRWYQEKIILTPQSATKQKD